MFVDFFKAEWGEFETAPGTLTGGAKVTWSSEWGRNDAGQPVRGAFRGSYSKG